jgi:FtsZ-binding cell division protein ZapB
MTREGFDLEGLGLASRRASLLSGVGALLAIFALVFLIFQLFVIRDEVEELTGRRDELQQENTALANRNSTLRDENAELESRREALQGIVKALDRSPDAPDTSYKDLPPRVYFHIEVESDRASARDLAARLEKRLADLKLVVPGVERVDVDVSVDQLRFFKREEESLANRIASVFEELGNPVQVVPLWQRYGDSTKIRPRHFELWLTAD